MDTLVEGISIIEGLGGYRGISGGNYVTASIAYEHPVAVLTTAERTTLRAVNGTGPYSYSLNNTDQRAGSVSIGKVMTYSVSAVSTYEADMEYLVWAYMLNGSSTHSVAAISASLWVASTWTSSANNTVRSTARTLARVYDTFYTDMSPAQRTTVAAAIGTWGQALCNLVSTSYEEFYGPTTGNNLIYLANTAAVMYSELPAAQTWMAKVLDFLTSSTTWNPWPQWRGQRDGGLAQGLYYGVDNHRMTWDAFEALRRIGLVNMWSSSFVRNIGNFFMYAMPPLMQKYGHFGEGGQNVQALAYSNAANWDMLKLSQVYQNANWRWWESKKLNQDSSYSVFSNNKVQFPWQLCQIAVYENDTTSYLSGSAPSALANYYCFQTTGYAFMHTDLDGLSASSMVGFASRPYPMGACGHIPQDNNSFIFYHNNEPLLIRSGPYLDGELVTQNSVQHVYWGMQAKSSNNVCLVRDTTLDGDLNENVTASIAVVDGTIFAGFVGTFPTIWDPATYVAPGLDPARETPWLKSCSGNNLYFQRGISATSASQQIHGTYWASHSSGELVELVVGPYHDYDNDKLMATASGMIVVFSGSETYQYVVGDNTSAFNCNAANMMTCSRRHIVFVSDASAPYMVMVDQVEAAGAWKYRQYLHAYNTWSYATASNQATANCTFSYATVQFIDGVLGGTFSMTATEESDPPIRHLCALGEKPQDSWSAANQALYGLDQHFWATTHTYSSNWYIGTVVYPYLSGSEAGVPVIAGTYSDTWSFQMYVGSASFDFSLAASPSVAVTFPA